MLFKFRYTDSLCFTIFFIITTVFTSQARESKEIFFQDGLPNVILSICFSPDGKYLASGNENNTINLWNVKSGVLIRTLKGHLGDVNSINFSPNRRYLVSGSSDNTIKLWNLKDGAFIRTYEGHSSHVTTVSFSSDSKRIVSGSRDNTIKIWNISNGVLIRNFKGDLEPPYYNNYPIKVSFSSDDRFIISGNTSDKIKILNVKDGSLFKSFNGHSGSVESVSLSPDGRLIASGKDHMDHTIKLWNFKDGSLIRTIYEHSSYPYSVSFSPDSRLIASGSLDGTIRLWNVKDDEPLLTIYAYSVFPSSVLSICFSPDGKYIASGGRRKPIKLWNVKDGKLIRSFRINPSGIFSVDFSPNGRYIVSGSKTIKLWDVKKNALIRTLKGHSSSVFSVCFSPDGEHIASGSHDNTIKLWNVKAGSHIRTFKGHSEAIGTVSFSPDGKSIASGSYDETLRLWNVKDGTLIRTFKEHPHYILSVSFSPDGKLIASGNFDDTITIWNVKKGSLFSSFKDNYSAYENTVCFSPEGKSIVSGSSRYSSIKLWNIKDGKLVNTFEGHSSYVTSVRFSPDGKNIVSGSIDKTIKLWNVKNGTLIRTFEGHSAGVNSVCFSPDGKLLATGSGDNTLRIWNTDNENASYIYALLPNNEWISFKPGQPYYNASPGGDKYAALRFNNDTFNYEPLIKYRNQYKKTNNVTQQPTIPENNNKEIQIKLLCTFESIQLSAYDIDEDIKVFSNCSNKYTPFKYNNNLQIFTGPLECPDFFVNTYKFEPQTSYPNTKHTIQLSFYKPVLYVLINPSLNLNKAPLSHSKRNFDKMKDQLRNLSSKMDNNPKYRFWNDRFLRTYFYTKHADNEAILLSSAGIFATKWDDPNFISTYNDKLDFKYQSIPYDQLINDACNFFNGFSISDDLSIKGAALIIIGAPKSPISKNELSKLDQKLHQNKHCALIVQFGENKKDIISKGKFQRLKIMELNLENEFYKGFFEVAFEKIITEFEVIVEQNTHYLN